MPSDERFSVITKDSSNSEIYSSVPYMHVVGMYRALLKMHFCLDYVENRPPEEKIKKAREMIPTNGELADMLRRYYGNKS